MVPVKRTARNGRGATQARSDCKHKACYECDQGLNWGESVGGVGFLAVSMVRIYG